MVTSTIPNELSNNTFILSNISPLPFFRSLCDGDEDGRLSQHEFCVGMFLIDGRLQGNRVPDTLPDELIE